MRTPRRRPVPVHARALLRDCLAFNVALALWLGFPAASKADGPFAYITNAESDDVSVIDTATESVIATVPVGHAPIGVAVNRFGTKVYVANYCNDPVCNTGGSLSVIDSLTNSIVATVQFADRAWEVALSPDGSRAYVTHPSTDTVSVVDTASNTVIATAGPMDPSLIPTGIAADPSGPRVYVAGLNGVNSISVIDTDTNTVTATAPVASPANFAVSPALQNIYVTEGAISGGVTVINRSSATVTALIGLGGGEPYGAVADPMGSRVYVGALCNNDRGCSGATVSVIDTSTNTVTRTVPLAGDPFGIDVTPDGKRLYVAIPSAIGPGFVSVLDTTSYAVVATIPVGVNPQALGRFITPGHVFIVNTTLDAPDANPGDGICETAPGNGICSLRAAIMESNAFPGVDTISIPPGFYRLVAAGSAGTSASAAALSVTAESVLVGSGSSDTVIDANGASIGLLIESSINVHLSDVTIQNAGGPGLYLTHGAQASVVVEDSVFMGNRGGGVSSFAEGTIRNCLITGNTGSGIIAGGEGITVVDSVISNNATTGDGGGVYWDGEGGILLDNVTIRGNHADGDGGGVFAGHEDIRLFDSTVDGNSAGGCGGGIRELYGFLRVDGSTVSNNRATTGGGICTSSTGQWEVSTSTVSGNSASDDGGGLAILSYGGTIEGSTVAGNVADSDGNGVGDGGGVWAPGGDQYPLMIRNTIVAGNTDRGGESPDCGGTLTSQGYILIQSTTGCTISGDLTGNVIGRDPNLGPLADNGGPTLTQALIPPSPALSAGNPAVPGSGGTACDATDQRGVSRPQPAAGRCDIGAVENACGNGVLEPNLGEQCDDGNQAGADGCEALCTLPTSCSTPVVIPAPGGTFTGTTSGRGALGGTCAKLGSAPEQVFQWTPDTSGPASVETCGTGTDYDTALYVRRGSCATGTEVACNDDACANASGKGLASRASLSVTAGQPYFIVVDGWAESHGNFSLKVTPPPPAAACVSPTIIPAGGGTFTGTTTGASSLAGSCAPTNNSPETVFKWTPAVSGTATIQTCSTTQTSFDTVLYVHAGSCTSGNELACNDDTTGCATNTDVSNPHRGSLVRLPVTAGQPYFIVVDGYNGAKGGFSLSVTPPVGSSSTSTTVPSTTVTSTTAATAPTTTATTTTTSTTLCCVFGSTVIGSNSDPATADVKRASKFTLSEPANVTSVSMYLANRSASSQVVKGVIYADAGGSPGARTAITNEVTVAPGTAPGWVAFPMASAVVLSPGDYWLAQHFGPTGASISFYSGATAGARSVNGDLYSDGPSDPFGPVGSTGTGPLSIYAVYSRTAATTTTTSIPAGTTTSTTVPAGTCGTPIAVPAAGGVFTGMTSGASAQAGSCASQSGNAPERVFAWTPTASGVATIQTCGAGTGFDTVLYMRSGNCASGAELACNDDTAGCGTGDVCGTADHHGSRITPTVSAGQPYFIFVDGYAGSCGGSSGAFSLTVTPRAVPTTTTTTTLPAGTCGNPTVIPAAGGTFRGATSGTSALSGTCASASGSAPEKVFAWTPTTSGVATIQTCGAGTTFDTVVYMKAGTCGGTEVACNDDTSGCGTGDGCVNAGHHGSRITPTVSAGQTYYIVVDGYSGSCGGSSGAFGLTVTAP